MGGELENPGVDAVKVQSAKDTVQLIGVITSVKTLGKGLYEKKWNSGLRLYSAVVSDALGNVTLLILGSGKGKEQDRAIARSREIMTYFDVYLGSIAKKD